MKYANNIAAIDELSASEGVFTTAQAQRSASAGTPSPTPARSGASSASPTARIASPVRRARRPTSWPRSGSSRHRQRSRGSGKLSGTAWPSVALRLHGSWESGTSTSSPTASTRPSASTQNRVGAFWGEKRRRRRHGLDGRPACHPRRENACRPVPRLRGPVACRRRLPRRRGPRSHRLCEAWHLLDELGENKRRAALLESLARALSASDQKGRS